MSVFSRRRRIITALCVGGLLLLAVGLPRALPSLVERAIVAAARRAGLVDVTLEVSHVGWRLTEIENLRVGGGPEIEVHRLVVEYSPLRLLQGRIANVTASGVRVRSAVGRDGSSVAGLNLLRGDGRRRISFSNIFVRSARLELESPVGALVVLLNADAQMSGEDTLRVSSTFELMHGPPGVARRASGRLRARTRIGRSPISTSGDSAESGGSADPSARFTWARLALSLRVVDRELTAPLDARFGLALDGGGLRAAARLRSVDERVRVQFDLRSSGVIVRRDRSPVQFRHDPDITAHLDIAIDDASIPHLASGLTVEGGVEFAYAGRSGSVRVPTGIRAQVEGLDPALLGRVTRNETVRSYLVGPISLRIAAPGGPAPIGVVRKLPDGVGLSLRGSGRLAAGRGPSVEVDLDGFAAFAREAPRLRRFRVSSLRVHAVPWEFRPGMLCEGEIEISLAGTPEHFRGGAGLRVKGHGALGSRGSVAEAALRTSTDVVFDQGRLTFSLDDCGEIRVSRLSFTGVGEISEPVVLCLAPEAAAPLLRLGLSEAGARTLWSRFAIAPARIEGALLSRSESQVVVTGETPRVSIAAEVALDDGTAQGSVVARRGSLELPQVALTMDGIDVTLEWSRTAAGVGAHGRFAVEEIRALRELPLVRPLSLTGRFDHRGDAVDFRAHLHDRSRVLVLEAEGSHAVGAGAGAARVRLAPLRFQPGLLQPADLLPVLRGLVSASGAVGASGGVQWSAGGLRSDIDLRLERLSFTWKAARVEDVDATVRFDRPWPPSTPPSQRIEIGRLRSVLELTDGLVGFQLRRDGRLDVEQVQWRTLGGIVRAQGLLDPYAPRQHLTFRAGGLDLSALLAQVDIEGLSGEGVLAGEIPVVREGGRVAVRQAWLGSTGAGGWVRYRPSAVPSALGEGHEEVDLVLAAVENFNYETLRVTVDGEVMEDIDIGFRMRGANPDLYAGHPIDFNLHVSGALGRLLAEERAVFRIERQLRGKAFDAR